MESSRPHPRGTSELLEGLQSSDRCELRGDRLRSSRLDLRLQVVSSDILEALPLNGVCFSIGLGPSLSVSSLIHVLRELLYTLRVRLLSLPSAPRSASRRAVTGVM